jgi:hypothetical protein
VVAQARRDGQKPPKVPSVKQEICQFLSDGTYDLQGVRRFTLDRFMLDRFTLDRFTLDRIDAQRPLVIHAPGRFGCYLGPRISRRKYAALLQVCIPEAF